MKRVEKNDDTVKTWCISVTRGASGNTSQKMKYFACGGGAGGQKRQNIFQTGRRKVISFMQIRALLAQMEACSCRAIMNHSSCQEMLARSYGAPDLTSLSA